MLEETCSSDVDLNNKLTFALIIDHRRRYLVNFCSNLLLLFALTHISFSFSSPTLWFEVVFFLLLGVSSFSAGATTPRFGMIYVVNLSIVNITSFIGSLALFHIVCGFFSLLFGSPRFFCHAFAELNFQSELTLSCVVGWFICESLQVQPEKVPWRRQVSSFDEKKKDSMKTQNKREDLWSLKSRKTFLINLLLPVSYVNFFTSSSQQHNSSDKAERKATKILPSTLTHLMILMSKILTHKRICLLLGDDMCLSCTVIKQQQSESMAI